MQQEQVLIIQFICFTIISFLNGFKVFLRGNWDASTFVSAYISESIDIYIHTNVVRLLRQPDKRPGTDS